MLSPKIKRNLGRIIPFGVIWLIFSIVYILLEKGLLGSLNYYPSTTNPYNFSRNIFFTPVFALFTGLVIGTIEVLYFNQFFGQVVLTNFFYRKVSSAFGRGADLYVSGHEVFYSYRRKIRPYKYFEMLKEYYFDLSDPIISYSGEIYQTRSLGESELRGRNERVALYTIY